jgi:hypothetical protein
MPEYEFWYSETYTYKAWFRAENKEHAIEKLEAVFQGDIDLEDDLSGFGKKSKGYEIDLDPLSIEEI